MAMNIRKTTKELFPIPGFEKIYAITKNGEVYNISRKKHFLRKWVINKNGYFSMKLSVNKTYKMVDKHRILATIFIPNEKNLPQVHHIDSNKLNNSISNLMWVDNRWNQIYRFQKESTSSGVIGVTWHKLRKKWQAGIKINKKFIHLGLFENKNEAKKKYLKALSNL